MNILIGIDFESPVVQAFTSEQTACPATNAINYGEPNRPWRTGATSQQDLTLDLLTSHVPAGVHLNRTNYHQVLFYRSVSGTTFDNCSSNVLFWSHRPKQTAGQGAAGPLGWTSSGLLVVPDVGPGPEPWGELAQSLSWSSGGSNLTQQVSTGGFTLNNRPVAWSAWLKAPSGSPQVGLRIQLGTTIWAAITPTITSQWTRYSVAATMGSTPVTTTAIALLAPQGTTGSVLFGGAQLTFDASAALDATFETEDLGMVVPVDVQTGRRLLYYDFGNAASMRYLRMRIPSQTPDGLTSYFETGGVAPMRGVALLSGLHQFPRGPAIEKPRKETVFPNLHIETLKLGNPLWSMSFRGRHRTKDVALVFYTLSRHEGPVLVGENIADPEAPKDYYTRKRTYMAVQTEGRMEFPYEVPEILDNAQLSFREIA